MDATQDQTVDRTDDDAPRERRPMPRGQRLALTAAGIGLILLLAAGTLLSGIFTGDEAVAGGLRYTIPAGTADNVVPQLESAIEIPTEIRFESGEAASITIRNDDEVGHRAGPWIVGPGQTYTQRFPEPGTYPIACSVDPKDSVVVTVEG